MYMQTMSRQMECSRNRLEEIVIGTLLNEYGTDGFFAKHKMVLRKELFADKRNVFLFGLIEGMFLEGRTQTTPKDVLDYAMEKNIRYGNLSNFLTYMCDLAYGNYAFVGFGDYVRRLVDLYVKDMRYAGTR